jgi:hypothetical protein
VEVALVVVVLLAAAPWVLVLLLLLLPPHAARPQATIRERTVASRRTRTTVAGEARW